MKNSKYILCMCLRRIERFILLGNFKCTKEEVIYEISRTYDVVLFFLSSNVKDLSKHYYLMLHFEEKFPPKNAFLLLFAQKKTNTLLCTYFFKLIRLGSLIFYIF